MAVDSSINIKPPTYKDNGRILLIGDTKYRNNYVKDFLYDCFWRKRWFNLN